MKGTYPPCSFNKQNKVPSCLLWLLLLVLPCSFKLNAVNYIVLFNFFMIIIKVVLLLKVTIFLLLLQTANWRVVMFLKIKFWRSWTRCGAGIEICLGLYRWLLIFIVVDTLHNMASCIAPSNALLLPGSAGACPTQKATGWELLRYGIF